MSNQFPGGVWPVMLTPFTKDNQIDYPALEELVNWYIEKGVDGLFAVCQSSEMFFLTEEESIQIASFVKEKAAGRVPVIASGHTASALEDQVIQIKKMAATGVDAVILITNRLVDEHEDEDVFRENIYKLIEQVPADIPLGFYECPKPYKRLISPNLLKELAFTGRFYFLKDTCCDREQIEEKLKAARNTNLKIYNANTATLLETLQAGVAGYSGVMANFQPDLYVWLMSKFKQDPQKAETLQNFLSMSALIERQNYPENAKYFLQLEGLSWTNKTRTSLVPLTPTDKLEVQQLQSLTSEYRMRFIQNR
ncbi:dihydrodipicolinate synthase family protein [Oceanobacillus sp. CFH 90083]|uniref:dihydrodipicolinate synthase family protein n=1 Tax=Oceanobacillus sp. CFH 90083 TaxID=2592336 RepID=UPI00128E432D|nr:dihydrodipicolinate synthase family protein [Oceanobacillus sp. CFH 90083]